MKLRTHPPIFLARGQLQRLPLLLLFAILFSGCNSRSEATPTPTKTPDIQAQQTYTPTPAPPTATAPPVKEAPTPTPTAPTATNLAPYTGLPVDDPSLLEEAPIFVCLNNDLTGRASHHGLNAADVTYEYIIDGFASTRITSMYQSASVERIGPVRSARWPNIHMTYMYDGVLACSGGSDGIRYLLKNEVGFPYLDADADDTAETSYFFSLGTNYRTRLQASTEGVRRWLADMTRTCEAAPLLPYCDKVINPWLTSRSTPRPWERASFLFSEMSPDFSAGESTTIRIPYPGSGNDVEWRYDPESGRYLRFQDGAPHMDQATGQQISSDNVIVLFAEHELTDIVEDSLGTRSVKIHLYGFGALRLFRDVRVYEGTWRASDQSPPRWIGPGEQTIPLKPGRTWIQVIRTTDTVNY